MPERNAGRSRRKLIGYIALTLAVAVAATIALYSIYQSPSAASTGVARTVSVTRGTVQSSVSASGNTSAATSADEDFNNSGTLTAVNVAVGDKVTAGEVLATIDSTQAEANLQSAQASLAGAETTLAHDQAGGTPQEQARPPAAFGLSATAAHFGSEPVDERSDVPQDSPIHLRLRPGPRLSSFGIVNGRFVRPGTSSPPSSTSGTGLGSGARWKLER